MTVDITLHAALALIGLTSQARPDLEGAMAGRELFDGDGASLGVYTASEAWDLVRARTMTYPLSVLKEQG